MNLSAVFMGKKSVKLNMSGAKIGWSGSQGGNTVELEFSDDKSGMIGTLRISKAALYWRGAHQQEETRVPVDRINVLFDLYQRQ